MEFIRTELSILLDKTFREMVLTEMPTLKDVKEEKEPEEKELKTWPEVSDAI